MNTAKNVTLIFFFSVCFSSFGQQNRKTITNLIFQKTNLLRIEKGLEPFKKLDTLDYLAQYHSDNMVQKKFYEHIDHEGLSPVERAEKLNIQAWRIKGNTLLKLHGLKT